MQRAQQRIRRSICLLLVLVISVSAFGSFGAAGVSRSEIDALEQQKSAIAEK